MGGARRRGGGRRGGSKGGSDRIGWAMGNFGGISLFCKLMIKKVGTAGETKGAKC